MGWWCRRYEIYTHYLACSSRLNRVSCTALFNFSFKSHANRCLNETRHNLCHVMNILSGLKAAPISGLGTMLNYLPIVELWVVGYLLVMWSYKLLAIFGHVELWVVGYLLVIWSYCYLINLNHFEFEKSSLHLNETVLVVRGAL